MIINWVRVAGQEGGKPHLGRLRSLELSLLAHHVPRVCLGLCGRESQQRALLVNESCAAAEAKANLGLLGRRAALQQLHSGCLA